MVIAQLMSMVERQAAAPTAARYGERRVYCLWRSGRIVADHWGPVLRVLADVRVP